VDLSQFAIDALVVVAVYVIINLVIKPLLEVWLKPDAPAHDPAIRGLAVALGILGVFLDHGLPPSSSGAAWIGLVVSGILSGLSSVGLYHAATPAARTVAQTALVTTNLAPLLPSPPPDPPQ